MKYFIALIIFGILFFTVLPMDFAYKSLTLIVLYIFFFALLIIWDFSVIKRKINAEFAIKSTGKHISRTAIFFALAWSIGTLTDETSLPFAIIFWIMVVAELIMHFVYKKVKPSTIFITADNDLILSDRWLIKRQLNTVRLIKYDRFSKNLIIKFDKKGSVYIRVTEHAPEDIRLFLELIIERSDHEVKVPANFPLKTQTP